MGFILPKRAAGITNIAPSGTLTKSDGTNLVASQINDDGSAIDIGTIASGPVHLYSNSGGTIELEAGNSQVTVKGQGGDNSISVDVGTNGTISLNAVSDSLAISGTDHTIILASAAKTNINAATGVNLQGTNTNDNAAAGYVGELLTASRASGDATSLSTGTAKTVISVSLTAGDWEVTGSVQFVPSATTTTAYIQQGASLTDNTLGGEGTFTSSSGGNLSGTVLGSLISENIPAQRFSLAATTTIYLVAKASFAISTETAYATIRARRVR